MTMQGPKPTRGSNPTVNDLELHYCSTPEVLLASSLSTLCTSSVSDTSSVSGSKRPWWEAQAKHILQGTDSQAIQLLQRYRICRDDDVPSSILRKKQALISYRALPDFKAPRVALMLNQESLSWFKKITFLEHVREALYPEENVYSVKAFRDWHDGLFHQVSNHLKSSPQEAEKYNQIEQQLPKGSLVHWAVSQSLLLARSHHLYRGIASQPNLEFIYGPLRDLFAVPRDLTTILKQFAVLEARFERSYLQEEEINWTHNFDTNTDFFDRASATAMSPQDLAKFLTASDLNAFKSLCPESIINYAEDESLQHMHKRWNKLCQAAQESITVERCLSS